MVAALKHDRLEPLKIVNAVDYARLIVDLHLQAYLHPLSESQSVLAKENGKGGRGLEGDEGRVGPVTMVFSNSVPRLLQICKNFVFDLASFVDLSSPNCVQVSCPT